MDFEKLNKQAKEAKYLIAKEKGEKVLDAKMQDEHFVEYLISYLEPYIEQVANSVIENNGEKKCLTIQVNDIIDGYEVTDYIAENYTKYIDESPIVTMIEKFIRQVTREYQCKLPQFEIGISSAEEIGDDFIEYMIIITMSYYKE